MCSDFHNTPVLERLKGSDRVCVFGGGGGGTVSGRNLALETTAYHHLLTRADVWRKTESLVTAQAGNAMQTLNYICRLVRSDGIIRHTIVDWMFFFSCKDNKLRISEDISTIKSRTGCWIGLTQLYPYL